MKKSKISLFLNNLFMFFLLYLIFFIELKKTRSIISLFKEIFSGEFVKIFFSSLYLLRFFERLFFFDYFFYNSNSIFLIKFFLKDFNVILMIFIDFCFYFIFGSFPYVSWCYILLNLNYLILKKIELYCFLLKFEILIFFDLYFNSYLNYFGLINFREFYSTIDWKKTLKFCFYIFFFFFKKFIIYLIFFKQTFFYKLRFKFINCLYKFKMTIFIKKNFLIVYYIQPFLIGFHWRLLLGKRKLFVWRTFTKLSLQYYNNNCYCLLQFENFLCFQSYFLFYIVILFFLLFICLSIWLLFLKNIVYILIEIILL